jgi:hypothetical protein
LLGADAPQNPNERQSPLTIGVQQNYTRRDFNQVPDDPSIAQAAEILRKGPTPATNSAPDVAEMIKIPRSFLKTQVTQK